MDRVDLQQTPFAHTGCVYTLEDPIDFFFARQPDTSYWLEKSRYISVERLIHFCSFPPRFLDKKSSRLNQESPTVLSNHSSTGMNSRIHRRSYLLLQCATERQIIHLLWFNAGEISTVKIVSNQIKPFDVAALNWGVNSQQFKTDTLDLVCLTVNSKNRELQSFTPKN